MDNEAQKLKVLVQFAHPALEKSRVNAAMLAAIQDVEGVTINDLYELYPNFHIWVQREQQLLLEHDVVVFHFPMYWYSTPALLKQWIDLVLQHGWAYGHAGKQLSGKYLLCALSTGGPEASYTKVGNNRFFLGTFLSPIIQTSRLCNMVWLPPFVAHGTHRMDAAAVALHAANYRQLLTRLTAGTLPLHQADEVYYLNELLNYGE